MKLQEKIKLSKQNLSKLAFDEALTIMSEPAFILKSEDDKPFTIAGYCSVDIIDSDGERVNLKGLNEAYNRMMKKVSRRNYMFHHGNIQIGELKETYTDPDGNVFIAGVDFDGTLNAKSLEAYGLPSKKGLFIIGELFDDMLTSKEVVDKMRFENRMLSFSIGGRVLPGGRTIKCDDETCWNELEHFDLHEITSCEEGKNIEADAFILKNESLKKYEQKEQSIDISKDFSKVYNDDSNSDDTQIKMENAEDILKEEAIDARFKKMETKLDDVIRLLKMKPKETYFHEKPKREDFEKAEDYANALEIHYSDEALAARAPKVDVTPEPVDEGKKDSVVYYKAPVKEDFETEEEFTEATKQFEALKAEILKADEDTPGTVIKKAKIPTKGDGTKRIDLDKIWKDVDEANSIKDVIF